MLSITKRTKIVLLLVLIMWLSFILFIVINYSICKQQGKQISKKQLRNKDKVEKKILGLIHKHGQKGEDDNRIESNKEMMNSKFPELKVSRNMEPPDCSKYRGLGHPFKRSRKGDEGLSEPYIRRDWIFTPKRKICQTPNTMVVFGILFHWSDFNDRVWV